MQQAKIRNYHQLAYPKLSPLLDPWIRAVTADHQALNALFEEYGSPLNIHHLRPFGDNYRDYQAVLQAHQLQHLVFFARKANKCRAFVAEANRLSFGVDTASYRELKQCLDLGCEPKRLVLTAAIKDERLVRLAVENEVLIVLDNEDECRLVQRVASELGKRPQVGVRLSGFEFEGKKIYSRFGFDVEAAVPLIAERMGVGSDLEVLQFRGFHFHLNGYSRQERGAALLQTIRCADALREHGIDTHFIDMGGGFLMNYLADAAEWETFWSELKRAVRGEREPITFGNDGLGYFMLDGELHGRPQVYPYYNESPRASFLEEVLAYQNEDGRSAAELLRERDIELRLEPGRSLLDQAGITLAKVAFRKKDGRGDWLIGLEMNMTQMYSSSADFLLDPILISQQTSQNGAAEPAAGYFVGAYCLERDVILKRKINFGRLPQIGDIVCFPNTAGYMMHFFESEAHLFELATNLVTVPSAHTHRFLPDDAWELIFSLSKTHRFFSIDPKGLMIVYLE